ncbi:MAG: ABC transporter permease [Firmicutes bacterium]|jgi:putative ABC transport system permease protein|nr:ABC transporter permease [Bacillota bacterium]
MHTTLHSIAALPWPWTFLLRNRSKGVLLLLLVMMSVLVITAISAITDSVMMTVYRSSVLAYEYASVIVSKGIGVPQRIIDHLRDAESVELVLPFLDSSVRVVGVLGSESRPVVAVPAQEFETVLSKLPVGLKGGRLPRQGEPEIAIHESIAQAKGVWTGDLIGREIDSDDYLWGAFMITGVLEGDIPVCLASLEYFKKQWVYDTGDLNYAYLVFPALGRFEAMNETLANLPSDEVTITTLESVRPSYNAEYSNIRLIMWAVDLLVVVIVSTAMGLVNTVHYLSRLREFALMSAIGLTPATLVLRTIVEVLSLGLVGFGAGLAAAKVTVSLLSACLFRPRGIEIAGIGWRSIVFAIPVPILVSVFSTITIWFNILKLDVVAMLEGRDCS